MVAADTRAADVPVIAAPSRESAPTWRQIIEPVQPFLQSVAERLEEQVEQFEPEIAGYTRYVLTNQGKQLRPALLALSAEATGGLNRDLVTAATIVEMVHLATLVHDDVMDEARLRRQRPTLAAHCGNAISVLVGDCLFSHALRMAASFPTPEVCRAVAEATKTVCSGEILQTQRQGQLELGRAEYFRILQMKTAALFALSCDMGAWLSGASTAERVASREYGLALGVAYQVYDDCLDLFGREAVAGKTLGMDLAGGKLTLPIIIALERASASERDQIEQLIERWNPAHLPRLLEVLDGHDALAECGRVVDKFCRSARESLVPLAPSDGRQALIDLTLFLAQQTADLGVSAWSQTA